MGLRRRRVRVGAVAAHGRSLPSDEPVSLVKGTGDKGK